MRSVKLACGLAILLLPACASIGGAPVDEAAELVAIGSTRPLREPLHPIRGGTRVLIFALDGVGNDDLRRAIREGRLPSVAALLGAPQGQDQFAHGYAAPAALSVLPSSTTPAWAAIFTGAPPAENGIPGNEWFVRQERKFYAPVPVTVEDRTHATKLYTDGLMSELLRAPTVYEGLPVRVHVSMHPIFRGADLFTIPEIADFGDLFQEMVVGMVGGGTTSNPDIYRETDQASIRSLVQAVGEYGLPDVQVVYFPGIDLFTHQAEQPLESQQEYLAEVTDPAIARVLELYRSHGALERTYVLFVSDHGHTPVLSDDRHSLYVDGDDEPTAVIEQAGFRLREPGLSADEEDYQAVVAYQGAMAYLYLADRSTCAAEGAPCDWSRPPRLEEDVLPLARALHAANATGAGVPALQGSLDLILARGAGSPDGAWGPFRVFTGDGLLSADEYLRRNPRPDLLDLERRLTELAVGPYGDRAGDILLLSRYGIDRPIEERFYFAPPLWSEHGSAHRQDSRISTILARAGGSGAELRAVVEAAAGGRSVTEPELAPLIRALLAR